MTTVKPARTESRGNCPVCGQQLTPPSPQFVSWCMACDWNVEAGAVFRSRARIRRSDRAALRDVRPRQAPTRPVHTVGSAAAFGIGVVVHGVTVALAATGLWLAIALWPNPIGLFAATPLLGTAVMLRPRLGRLPKGLPRVDRREAPELHALVSRIAGAVGCRPVDHVILSGAFGVMAGRYGLRRERYVILGLPLWNVLRPQERVALLAHELGHFVNRDPRRTIVIGSALDAFAAAHRVASRALGATGRSIALPTTADPVGVVMLTQTVRSNDDDGTAGPASVIPLMGLVFRAARGVVSAAWWALNALVVRSGDRAEYFADAVAARVGSATALATALDTLLADQLCRDALRGAATTTTIDPWQHERTILRSLPEHERERLRRVSTRNGWRVDAAHPPTHLRVELLHDAPPCEPQLVVDESTAATIDEELRPYFTRLGSAIAKAERARIDTR